MRYNITIKKTPKGKARILIDEDDLADIFELTDDQVYDIYKAIGGALLLMCAMKNGTK